MSDEVYKDCHFCGGLGYTFPKWHNGAPDRQHTLPCQNYQCSHGKVLDEAATAANRNSRLAKVEAERQRKQQATAARQQPEQRDQPPSSWRRRTAPANASQFDWLIASLFFIGSFYPITAIFKPTEKDLYPALAGMAAVGLVAGFNGQLIRTILKTGFAIALVVIVASKFGPEPKAAKPAVSEQPPLAASAFSFPPPKEETKPRSAEEKKRDEFFASLHEYFRAKEAGETDLVRPTWPPDSTAAKNAKSEVDTSFDWMDYSAMTLVSLGSLFLGLLIVAKPKPR